MNTRFSKLLLSVVLIVALAMGLLPAVQAQEGKPTYWPTEGWRTSTPEEQGMDSAALAAFIEQVPTLGAIDSLMIVRNGYVVTEVYWHPFQSGMKREQMSASKSIVSALVGIAIDKGYIESVDQKVLDFFPAIEVKNLDANKQAMTLRDLLTMTSGLNCDITQGTDAIGGQGLGLAGSPLMAADATQVGLNWAVADKPGMTWRYCQINPYLLSAILTRTTGMDTLTFAQQYLFAPLGITDAGWNVSAEGVALGCAGLQLNTQDMAKIGYLFLNNGRWGDAQVVPADWVRRSLQNYAPQRPWGIPDVGYGYLWWIYDTPFGGFFEAQGAYFQHIEVSPEKNLVVAVTGTDMTYHVDNIGVPAFVEAILQAVKSEEPLPPNPEGVTRLEAAVQAAANPEPQPVEALPPLAATISGKTYRLTNPNLLLAEGDVTRLPKEDWQMATLRLDFEPDSATLTLESESGKSLTVPVGLDGVYRVSSSYVGTLAAQGQWVNDMRFALYLRRLEQGPVLKYTLDFSDGTFTGTAQSARPGDAFAPDPSVLGGQMLP